MSLTDFVTFPSHITKISTLHDRCLRLIIDTTREATDVEGAVILSLRQKDGYTAFKVNKFTDDELSQFPEPTKDDLKPGKSQSKRLRATLYVLWKQEGENGEFETFYHDWMEKIIEKFKEKLEPES
jgi:hypothetical protein